MSRALVVRACAIGDFILSLTPLQTFARRHGIRGYTFVGYPTVLELARLRLPVDGIYSIETEPWRRLFNETGDGLPDTTVYEWAIVWMSDPAAMRHVRATRVIHAPAFPKEKGIHAGRHLWHTLGLEPEPSDDSWMGPGSTVFVHPGSGSVAKRWPHFEQLVERLPDVRVILGPAEEDMRIQDAVRSPDLLTLSEDLRRCRAYVGNDSGITHLAAYIGCPTVALFGTTDPAVWSPEGRRVQVLWEPELGRIRVERVLDVLRTLPR